MIAVAQSKACCSEQGLLLKAKFVKIEFQEYMYIPITQWCRYRYRPIAHIPISELEVLVKFGIGGTLIETCVHCPGDELLAASGEAVHYWHLQTHNTGRKQGVFCMVYNVFVCVCVGGWGLLCGVCVCVLLCDVCVWCVVCACHCVVCVCVGGWGLLCGVCVCVLLCDVCVWCVVCACHCVVCVCVVVWCLCHCDV